MGCLPRLLLHGVKAGQLEVVAKDQRPCELLVVDMLTALSGKGFGCNWSVWWFTKSFLMFSTWTEICHSTISHALQHL